MLVGLVKALELALKIPSCVDFQETIYKNWLGDQKAFCKVCKTLTQADWWGPGLGGGDNWQWSYRNPVSTSLIFPCFSIPPDVPPPKKEKKGLA